MDEEFGDFGDFAQEAPADQGNTQNLVEIAI
jgi:hypothetical protein